MMNFKYVLTLLVFILSTNANAELLDLPSKGVSNPTTVDVGKAEDYKADIKGRNKNVIASKLDSNVGSNGAYSRAVHIKHTSSSVQFENLESTSGELIRKLEDDRLKQAKSNELKVKQVKQNLEDTYNTLHGLDISNLGAEQDPHVQNAFKCSNIKNCDKSDNDKHAMKECTTKQRLHWNGQQWSCIDVLAEGEAAQCDSSQFKKGVNNGTACVDYVYAWVKTATSACQTNNTRTVTYKCYKKQTVSSSTNVGEVADTYCLTGKPPAKESCVYKTYSSRGSSGGSTRTTGTYYSRDTGRSYRRDSAGRNQEKRDKARQSSSSS